MEVVASRRNELVEHNSRFSSEERQWRTHRSDQDRDSSTLAKCYLYNTEQATETWHYD